MRPKPTHIFLKSALATTTANRHTLPVMNKLSESEILAAYPNQQWAQFYKTGTALWMTDEEAHAAHRFVCSVAGEGVRISHTDALVNLGGLVACFDEVLVIQNNEGLLVVYSIDRATGEVCVELVSRGSL